MRLVPKSKKSYLRPISGVVTDDERSRLIQAVNGQTSIANAIRQLIIEFIIETEKKQDVTE